MNRIVVIGASNFIAFSLCKKLIEEEYEVLSIETEQQQRKETDEMLMEIGRNAFFQYKNVESLELLESESGVAAFYFPEKKLTENEKKHLNNLSQLFEIVYIIQRVDTANDDWIEYLDSLGNVVMILFNEVFGPWQPEKDTIQRIIFNKVEGKMDCDGENDMVVEKDYIYVEDVSKLLVSLLESKERIHQKVLLVTNPNKNVSDELAVELSIKLSKVNKSPIRKGESVWNVIDCKPTYTVKQAVEDHVLHSKIRRKRM
ncbi:NAD-dependent epimerase/dehydratase family protein [Bacillus alkalisoli]|uniref:hypothetical protein n=1 Tax=Bacillus alkalisoli TaxID=2011008 RepID=UPI000C246262|nr:hypothetical protein [Bacillus alkalisoli]